MKSGFSPALLCLGAGLLVLTGCGVYAPHAPVTPILTTGQVEVKVAVAPLMSLSATGSRPWVPATEGHIAYSPAPHLLLAVAGGGNYVGVRRPSVPTYYRERQADVAVGYYLQRGAQQQWYLAGMAGTGVGRVDQSKETKFGSFLSIYSNPYHLTTRYASRYRREFAQIYAALDEGITTAVFGCRASRLRYNSLAKIISSDNTPLSVARLPTTAVAAWYLEPSIALRAGQGACQGVWEAGLRIPLDAPVKDAENPSLYTETSLFTTIGVIWRPRFTALSAKKSSPD